MTYAASHYNEVFQAMRERFGESWYASVDWPRWGVVWRRRIKQDFFDQGILIAEMVAGLDEAAGKRRWPVGTSFFHRLHDVVLKNRREYRTVKIHDGPQPIGALMKHTIIHRNTQ